jgi:two-component system chemotaxis sensor kinase CheA
MNTLLQEFINESRELLEEASQAFLHLENNPDDLNILNGLFRAIHTIKGSSGLFDIAPLTNVVHAAEDVLDIVREGRLKLSPDMVDILLDSLDQVNTWLDDLEAEEKLSPDAEEISEELKTKLRGMISNVALENGQQETDTGHEAELGSNIDWLAKISEEERQRLVRQAQNLKDTLLAITYIPDEQCFFNGDDPLYTMRQIPELCWFGIETREPWPDINEFDPFTCLVQFYALTRTSLEEIKELFTYVEEEVQQTRIAVQDLIFPQGEVGDNEPFGLFVQDATQLIDDKDWSSLVKAVDVALEVAGPDLFQASALRWLKVVLEHPSGPNESLIKNLVQAVATGIMPEGEVVEEQEENKFDYPQEEEQKGDFTTQLALDILRTQQKLLQLPCAPELWTGRLLSIGEVLKRSLPFSAIEKSTEEISALIDKAQKEKSFSPLLAFITDILSSKDSTEPEPVRKEPEKQAPVQQGTEKNQL